MRSIFAFIRIVRDLSSVIHMTGFIGETDVKGCFVIIITVLLCCERSIYVMKMKYKFLY